MKSRPSITEWIVAIATLITALATILALFLK